jgi:HPt (histidine-containing phosphotransfer) domain-containing protein
MISIDLARKLTATISESLQSNVGKVLPDDRSHNIVNAMHQLKGAMKPCPGHTI